MMKKGLIFAFIVAVVLMSCSTNDQTNDPDDIRKSAQTPIGFSVQKQNITRATNMEAVKHYNFGVWAWKVEGRNGLTDAEIMNNNLVGYSDGVSKGYDNTNASTWASSSGTVYDQKSPWFYEKLGNTEYTYTGDAGFYTASQTAFMSANAIQFLRYWDQNYVKTNFYCYTPYDADVTFTKDATTSTMTFGGANTIRDGYEEPVNTAYAAVTTGEGQHPAYDRSLSEFMYAGVQASNDNPSEVVVPFKHMGAQLFIRFYEDIRGYKVEIIDLGADNGTMATGATTDMATGIQAAPASLSGTTYSKGSYYTTQGATISFAEATANPTYTANWTGSTSVQTPLMFKIPQAGLSTADVAPANLTDFAGLGTTVHKIIKESETTGIQEYSYSPTIYYPVAQPTTSTTGLTFHISYRLIAEDNKEVITVHNATVHVPVSGIIVEGTNDASTATAYITAWQPNVKYTYTFKFTTNSSGTTNPTTAIDPTDPTPSTVSSLYPIVFDSATIDDYSVNSSEYVVEKNVSAAP